MSARFASVPGRLRFADPAVERQFIAGHLAASLRQYRFATGLGALGVALIGLNSLLRWGPHEWPSNFMAITRYCLVLPWPLLLLALTWWKSQRPRLEFFACILMPAMLVCYFLSLVEKFDPVPAGSEVNSAIFLLTQFTLAAAVCLPLHTRAQALMTGLPAVAFPLLVVAARPRFMEFPFAAHVLTNGFVTAILTCGVATCVAWLRERGQRLAFAQHQQLQAFNAELARLNHDKDELMQIAAHDLRSPLAAVRHTAELAARDATGPAAPLHEPLRAIGETSAHMLEVVNRILDTHAVERGQLQPVAQAGDVFATLAACLARHRPNAARKQQVLALDSAAGPLAAVFDPTLFGQVLDNLVSNALKFSPPGATIRISALRAASDLAAPRVRVVVHDAGPGFSPADRANLFQPYARLSSRPTGGEDSSGLGLFAARKLILALQGDIGAAPAPDGGTIFWVELPAA